MLMMARPNTSNGNRCDRPFGGGAEPMGYVDGANLYQVELSDPINQTDSTGLQVDWHHLLPQAILKNILGQGAIDAAEFGQFMNNKDHSALHSAGWNEDWGKWVAEMKEARQEINVDSCRIQLDKFATSTKYEGLLNKGLPATISYAEWKDAPKAFKGFLDMRIGSLFLMPAEELGKLRRLMKAAGQAGKAAPIVMAFVQGLIIGHATTHEEHFQAFFNNSIDAITCRNGSFAAIRGKNYREARVQVAMVWAGNLDTWGYQSGENLVDAMADLLEAIYNVSHPAQTR